MNLLRFKNNDITFTARVVEQGDGYGRQFSLTHENTEPLIEFYDARYKMQDFQKDGIHLGQFVSRYNKSTFEQIKTGLFLDSGSTDWSLNEKSVKMIQEWMTELLSIPKSERILVAKKPSVF